MTSPFDFAKSITNTKEDLYTTESIFNKDYTPFMVNKALSNSPKTALFAAVMDRYPDLDKKIQYDFYRLGIPKQSGYSKWIKKEDININEEHLDFVCENFIVSQKRGLELYELIGPDKIQELIEARGGRN